MKVTGSKQESQITKKKTAADKYFGLLRKSVIMAVTDSLGYIIADDMKARPMFHSKRTLKGKILLDLGEKNSFVDFKLYLTDTKASLQKWITFYIEEHFTKSRIEKLLKAKLEEVTVAITEAVKDVTNVTDLHKQLSSVITVDEKDIKEVGACNFRFEITKGLWTLRQSLSEDSSPFFQMDGWSKQPCDILCDTMLGCCEQCPFCGEQCELTTPNHDCKHSVELHRPQCLKGYTWTSAGKMTLDVCSARVASDAKFKNRDTDHKLHPYQNYQKYYPNWIITPDPSCEASSYWKWFVARYSAQIVQLFNAKETKIPESWTSLTWEEVKEDLKTYYNL